LNPAEAAERFADARSGMALLDFCEVALPYWRVLARCEVLARKPISTIDETIMRAVALGVDQLSELELMLGLDETVLESAIVGLIADERLQSTGDETFVLTDGGQEVLANAIEIVSREQVVPFDYDGLLRRPVLVEDLLEPRRIRERGLREVPPYPARPPDVAELRVCRQDIVRLLRNLGDGRDQESQLLAIRGFDRRDRMYRPAVALLFVPLDTRGRAEIAFALEDELSLEHEAAFANAGLRERIAIERPLRSLRRRALVLPATNMRDRVDLEGEMAARERVREARAAAETTANKPEQDELREARRAFSALTPRTVGVHEHAALLQIALEASRERLLIAGGKISQQEVNPVFLRRLRGALARGTSVLIVTEGAIDGHARALDQLRALARDFPALVIDEKTKVATGPALLSDRRFAVVGRYNWLGHLGDPQRELGDRRSLLTTNSAEIDELWQSFDARPTAARSSSRRPRSRGRRSRNPRRPAA
jgi:hypothetical protein